MEKERLTISMKFHLNVTALIVSGTDFSFVESNIYVSEEKEAYLFIDRSPNTLSMNDKK